MKLLRAGCTVIATTRFPNSACETYRKEPDFHTFQQRLHIYGLDLRDITGIEAFTRYLKMKYSSVGIDILINNACQTVRRPNGYYIPIIQKEQAIWENSDTVHKQLLHGCYQFEQIRRQILLEHTHPNSNNSNNHNSVIEGGDFMTPHYLLNGDTIMKESDEEDTKIGTSDISAVEESTALVSAPASVNNVTTTTHFELSGITHSAAMSQMILLPEDVGVNDTILPPGVTDVNGQQIDLRTTNSWLLKMEEISTPELMECMFINAIAPFVLNSRLKPLMTIPTNNNDRPDRYIINVSAMEGKVR